MNTQAGRAQLRIVAGVGAALMVGTLAALAGSNLSPVIVVLAPIALLTLYVMLRHPISLMMVLLVAWCTAPTFEWITLGTIGGFTIRPDYVAIVLMAAIMLIGPHTRRNNSDSFSALRWGIIALVLAESLSLLVDALASGDVRLLLLLLIKTVGAGVGYLFLRSRLDRQHLNVALAVFIGLAIVPIAVSMAVGITHSPELFDMFLKGAGTQEAFSTPFGVVPRAFLLGAEPYLLAVFALCLTLIFARGVVPRIRYLAAAMVLALLVRLPLTWARNLIATYAVIFVLAIAASWVVPWMRISRKTRFIQLGLVVTLLVVTLIAVQNVPDLRAALDFTVGRFASIPSDVNQGVAGARYSGASLAFDTLSNDPIALLAGFGSRVEFIGSSLIPVSDIATPVGIWFKFGLVGLAAVVYASVVALQACRIGLKRNALAQLLSTAILLTLAGFWFQGIISASAFTSTPYATILVLGILFVFLELAAQESPAVRGAATANHEAN